MYAVLDGIVVAEHGATAASGFVNAAYFGGRAARSRGARRAAAVVLAGLCGGAACAAATALSLGHGGLTTAVAAAPSMLANLATLWLVTVGAGR